MAPNNQKAMFRTMLAMSKAGIMAFFVVPFKTSDDESVADLDSVVAALKRANSPGLNGRYCQIKASNGEWKVVSVWMAYTDVLEAIPNFSSWPKGPINPPTPLPRPYCIGDSDTPGAGEGMIAARDIKRGETIIIERPLLIIPIAAVGIRWEEFESIIETLIDGLDEDDRRRYMALKNCKPATVCGPLVGRARTNGLQAHFRQSKNLPTYSITCADISKANHRYAVPPRCASSDIHDVPKLLSKLDLLY